MEDVVSTAVKIHQPCEKCGSSDAAAQYSDGHWYCFSCGRTYGNRTENSMEQILEMTDKGKIREIADRCITEETCRKFGVRTLVHGGKIVKHFYPYYNKAGEKVAEKVRIVEGKQFLWTGDRKEVQLFGAQCQPTSGRFVVISEGECFKGDTCVLTKKGWTRLDEWAGQDVLQVTAEGASFVKPLAYINKPYNGTMYSIGVSRYNICTTPGHNLVVSDSKGWHKIQMKDVKQTLRAIPLTTVFSGEGVGYSDNLLRILVAISADGTIDTRKDGRQYIRISFLKNRKIERMRTLLRAEGIPYHEGVHQSGHTCFCFYCSEAFKEFPISWIHTLSIRQKLLVLEELQYWDGYKPKTRNQIEYYTTRYNNAVFVQTLAATSGIYGGICTKHYKTPGWSDGYTVRICFDQKTATISSKMRKEEHYTGRVYCVQVPSGMLLVRNGKHISVCGNCDALSLWQALGGRYTVVSLPDGCRSFKALKENYEYLDKFDTVVLCLDGDKPGRDAVERAVQYLPQKKTKVMRLPEDCKDPNEFLKRGKTQELLNYFWRAEAYTPKDIINISSMYDRLAEFRKTHQYVPTPWQGVNEMIEGTRPGQLVVLAAGTSTGKSLFLRTWMLHLLQTSQERLGALYLEENPEETVISLMSLYAGKNLKKNAVWDSCSEEEIRKYFSGCSVGDRIDLFEPLSNTEPDYICNKIRYMAVVRDCKVIFLDHITYLCDDAEDPTRTVNKLCKQLHDLCVELGITIIAACHLRKSQTNKSHEEGERVTLDDLKSSSSIKQLSDVVLGLERNGQDEDPIKANTTVVRVLKNRDHGSKGKATAVFYDKDTTRLEEVGLEQLTEPELVQDL